VTNTQVAFGDSDGKLTSSSNLVFDGDALGIGRTPAGSVELLDLEGTESGTRTVRITTTTPVAEKGVNGPYFDLRRTNSDDVGQANSNLGIMRWIGEDSAGNDTVYAYFAGEIYNANNGNEDGVLKVNIMDDGSATEYMRFTARDAAAPDKRGVVINEVSNDVSFRVESDGVNPAFMVDAGLNNVGIGAQPPSDVERLHIVGSGTADMVRITSTSDTSTDAPDLVLNRAKNPGATNDFIGRLGFRAKNSTGQANEYGAIRGYIAGATAGNENGLLQFLISKSGSTLEGLRVSSSNVQVNATGADIDFKVSTTQNTDNLLVNGATGEIELNGQVGINTNPDAGVEGLHVSGSGTQTTLVKFESTDTDAEVGPVLDMVRNPGQAGVAGDRLGYIRFKGPNSNSDVHNYADILCKIHDATAGSEDSSLEFDVHRSGTSRTNLRIRHSEVIINEDSEDVDFRVESNSDAYMLHVDAGLDKVAVGSAAQSGITADFQVPDGTVASYCNVTPLTGTSTVFANNDLQGHTYVLQSATNHTITLPETPVKGQWFKFLSTGGNITIDPTSGVSINGGTAGSTVTRSIDNQLYTMICLGASDWVVNNP
jgi:hypothetical protein